MKWNVWIDRGGTFTDIIAENANGELISKKVLSEKKNGIKDSTISGIYKMLKEEDPGGFSIGSINELKVGTTVATNALIERKGSKTLLVTTKGFADCLIIKNQNRPKIFDLEIIQTPALYSSVLEIKERLYSNGDIHTPLNLNTANQTLKKAFSDGFESIAIALLHADRHPIHELKLVKLARKIGFQHISASHEVTPTIKLVGRASTTVVDAYLSPSLYKYTTQISSHLENTKTLFMQSNGGLTSAAHFRGKDAVLSGPAGGVVAVAKIAKKEGIHKAISFDMGGTSTDIAHYAGEYERNFENTVSGITVRAPMLAIKTIAAGGGSICKFDGLRLRVGPESAGSKPGPVAYRLGGPLTITDCNVILGRIQPKYFPKLFGKNSSEELDIKTVKKEFNKLKKDIYKNLQENKTVEEIAEGFITVAIENMATAIKAISIQKGHDINKYTLFSYGGAAGQHACRLADSLNLTKIYIHSLSGVLAAYGIGLANISAIKEKTISLPLDKQNYSAIKQHITSLELIVLNQLTMQGIDPENLRLSIRYSIKYSGSDNFITIKPTKLIDAKKQFNIEHKKIFGFARTTTPLIVENIICEGHFIEDHKTVNLPIKNKTKMPKIMISDMVNVWRDNTWKSTPVFDFSNLEPGQKYKKPCLIISATNTILLENDWGFVVTPEKNLVLEKINTFAKKQKLIKISKSFQIEIFNSKFMNIAAQMGLRLQSTAQSVNIKERLDFSCAVFDQTGKLVANAPHIPVHLGSMGDSVKSILKKYKNKMQRGDVFVTNAPYNGGTHLPDITVISPVFPTLSKKQKFFVAARGHHTDIGGLTAGSMPSNSTSIHEEGVLISPMRLVSNGRFLEKKMLQILVQGPYPSRNPRQNIADLKAQVAACNKGILELTNLTKQYGPQSTTKYTQLVQNNAEEAVRRTIKNLKSGTFTAPMDDGSQIVVKVSINQDRREAIIDFTGTSLQRENNFNAPISICKSAVLYFFRTLIKDDIPLNEGCFEPLKIIVPTGTMLNPRSPAAIVAGNVETSQIICDTLYAATNQLAASQGTMNNFTFGNGNYQYYETLGGGTGAGPAFNGANAVQSHMTNSLLTDTEVLESRYPIIVDKFAVRRNSGGNGQYKGGNGLIRSLHFLEPMVVSIIAGRRKTKPFGIKGGNSGLPGITRLKRKNGSSKTLTYSETLNVEAGDKVTIMTPGGGGFGIKSVNSKKRT
ncbi:MAG: 5-oxoprolinase [Rhodospirillaceae bacterium]|nr:5-oxoprolinase [Rhodospirillaceae bacterium]